MFRPFPAVVASLAVCVFSAAVQAAPIQWTQSFVPFNAVTDVLNEGEFYTAANLGGKNNLVINGVSFEHINTGTYTDVNNITVSRARWTLSAGDLRGNNVDAPNIYQASTDADLNALLDGFHTGQTLTLRELTVGTTYVVQVWGMDARSNLTGKSRFSDDGSPANLSAEWNNFGTTGQGSAIGVFTADAQTQVIRLLSGDGYTPRLNAFSVHIIPEPASLGVLVPLASGFLLRRR